MNDFANSSLARRALHDAHPFEVLELALVEICNPIHTVSIRMAMGLGLTSIRGLNQQILNSLDFHALHLDGCNGSKPARCML